MDEIFVDLFESEKANKLDITKIKAQATT